MVWGAHAEDLEAGDVEHANEVLTLVLRVERFVDARDEPAEHAVVEALGDGAHRVHHLLLRLLLLHVLVAHLDLRLQQALDKVARVDAHQEGHLLGLCTRNVFNVFTSAMCIVNNAFLLPLRASTRTGSAVHLGLLLLRALLELHLAQVHDGRRALEQAHLLLEREAEDVERALQQKHSRLSTRVSFGVKRHAGVKCECRNVCTGDARP